MKVPLWRSGFAASREWQCLLFHLFESWLIKSIINLVNIYSVSPQIHYMLQ